MNINDRNEIQNTHNLLDSEFEILLDAARNGLEVDDYYQELRRAAATHYGDENLEELWVDSYDDYIFALVDIRAALKKEIK